MKRGRSQECHSKLKAEEMNLPLLLAKEMTFKIEEFYKTNNMNDKDIS